MESNNTEKKKGKSLVQLIKFALVGASNTLVDMIVNTGVSFVLNLITSGGWIKYAAKTVGYICGLLNSYFFNSRWTFREQRRRDAREKISFVAVNLLVLLISFAFIALFSDGVVFEKFTLFRHPLRLNDWWMGLGLPENLTKVLSGDLFCSLLSTCICIPINFILNKLFVFKPKKEEQEG